jgi:hypothetical protein
MTNNTYNDARRRAMLFASGVGSLNGEGWQVETYEKF